MVLNYPTTNLSLMIILPSSKEFPNVEKLCAFGQGGRTICNEIGIAVSTTEVLFSSTEITTRSSYGMNSKKSKA